ncbi:BON domain-containing protein [Nitrosophilus alvini]|uniref:BON domain-containing protein n=1 Tax=Nitrosophilus alvini TaxID=2714855 RepID=UPI00190B6DFD|nr:BON domain-containing protein [Nitrosophilus alvini]
MIKRDSLLAGIVASALMISTLNAASFEDINKTTQELLKEAYEMMKKSQEIIESFTLKEQKAIPSTKSGFQLYYKKIENEAPVEKRSDILIITQIKYRLLAKKEIASGNILVTANDGKVQLFGKVASKEQAEEVISTALTVAGVKEVESFLIVIEPSVVTL